MLMADTTEELRKRPEIRKELERARGEERREKIETHGRDRFWFVIYVVALAVCAAVYFLIGAKLIPLPDAGISIAQRILRGIALITVVLTVARAISFYAIGRIEDAFHLAECLVQPRAVELFVVVTARQPLAVFAGRCAPMADGDFHHSLGYGFHLAQPSRRF